uniref:Uncharacterized protein n=1 Tax=Arundo donax TaxID=35708 RepID=A0A0A9FHW1_ARUDO
MAEGEVGLATRGRRGRWWRQGRSRGRSAAARAVLGEEAGRRGGVVGVGGGGDGCVLHHG